MAPAPQVAATKRPAGLLGRGLVPASAGPSRSRWGRGVLGTRPGPLAGSGLASGRLRDGGSLRQAPRRAFQPAAAVTGLLAASAKARARGQPGLDPIDYSTVLNAARGTTNQRRRVLTVGDRPNNTIHRIEVNSCATGVAAHSAHEHSLSLRR